MGVKRVVAHTLEGTVVDFDVARNSEHVDTVYVRAPICRTIRFGSDVKTGELEV